MPGENCCIVGCGTCRNQKDLGIFKIPSPKDMQWRKKVLNIISTYRVIDPLFRKRIETSKVYICERHYEKDLIIQCKLLFCY